MNINKLQNLNKFYNRAEQPSEGENSTRASQHSSAQDSGDKVSIDEYEFRNNDLLIAKHELGKLKKVSSSRVNELKTKITEFQEAKTNPDKQIQETEMGKKINNPAVWQNIAHKILQ